MGWRRFVGGGCAVLLTLGSWAAAPGKVFILSAPSGTGKSTLARQLVQRMPGLVFAVSHTTRAPRPGEREGVDYFFVDDATFQTLLARNTFAEWTEIYGRRYGLSRAWVQEQLAAGKDLLMDLDTTAARTVRQAFPGAVSMFLLPPSAQELARRLRGRGSEGEAQIALRLGQAKKELGRYPEYDYIVINGTVEEACRELEAIILANRKKQDRMGAAAQRILEGF